MVQGALLHRQGSKWEGCRVGLGVSGGLRQSETDRPVKRVSSDAVA